MDPGEAATTWRPTASYRGPLWSIDTWLLCQLQLTSLRIDSCTSIKPAPIYTCVWTQRDVAPLLHQWHVEASKCLLLLGSVSTMVEIQVLNLEVGVSNIFWLTHSKIFSFLYALFLAYILSGFEPYIRQILFKQKICCAFHLCPWARHFTSLDQGI